MSALRNGLAIGIATLGLTGCGLQAPAPTSSLPNTVGTATPSAPSTSATPSQTATTAAPTSGPQLQATGKLVLYTENLVSDQLAGSCQVIEEVPTITLADDANDFFTSVELTVQLNAAGDSVAGVDIQLGEDSESITHGITAGPEVAGTSATVSHTATVVTVKGKGTMTDDGKVSTKGLPFTITANCSKFLS